LLPSGMKIFLEYTASIEMKGPFRKNYFLISL